MKIRKWWIAASLIMIAFLGVSIHIVISKSNNEIHTSNPLELPYTSEMPNLPNTFDEPDITNAKDVSDEVNESNESNDGRIIHNWDDFQFDSMCFIDGIVFEFLKVAYGKVDYYGEFKKGEIDKYDFYLEKYYKLVSNEMPFIDQTQGEEYYLNEFDTLAGYMEGDETITSHLKNKSFYFFDMDEDGVPELCVASEYIFKYFPDLGKCILWGGYKGNFYNSIRGSRKIAQDHGLASQISHEFYQLNENGTMEYSTFFCIRNEHIQEANQYKNVYIISLPIYDNKDRRTELAEETKSQAYSADIGGEIFYCFRVTEEQFDELTKDYFIAKKLSDEKIREVSFTYDELFGRLTQ